MAHASILRQLADADLDALHHKLRRDAESDAAIAAWAEARLGRSIGPSEGAKIMAIARYRKSPAFQKWLERWENQDRDLKAKIELQKQRFEYLSSLVSVKGEQGLYAASNHLKARLLTIAAEMSDEDLARGDVKWIKGLLQEIRDAEKMERQVVGEKAVAVAADKKLSPAEREARMKEIFGLT